MRGHDWRVMFLQSTEGDPAREWFARCERCKVQTANHSIGELGDAMLTSEAHLAADRLDRWIHDSSNNTNARAAKKLRVTPKKVSDFVTGRAFMTSTQRDTLRSWASKKNVSCDG